MATHESAGSVASRARVAHRHLVSACALVAFALIVPGRPAHAQDMDESFTLERFRLSADKSGMLDVEWAEVSKHLDWDVAFWLAASDDPLIVYRELGDSRDEIGALVSHRVAGTLVGSLGLFGRLQIGLEVPLILSQGQDEIALPGLMDGQLGSLGLGDIRVAPKVHLVARDGFHLAIIPNITLPSSGGDDYRGEQGVSFAPELVGSKSFGAWRTSLNLGYRARPEARFLNMEVNDEFFAHLGGGYRFDQRSQSPIPLELDVSVSAATGADAPIGEFNRNYLELAGGASYDMTRRLRLVLATGMGLRSGFGAPDWRVVAGLRFSRRQDTEDADRDGLVNAVDQCRDQPEDMDSFEDADGCPDLDNDNDGVPDSSDGAPLDPEDRDGFADSDGVPDPDNDGDGIADAEDGCPMEAENINAFEDQDGCPDADPDRDGDGIADARDACPNKAEDSDAFQDEDGCPDDDNDGDGVLDRADSCPTTAGPVENIGCPDTDRDNDTVVDRLDNCPDEPGAPDNHGCQKRQQVVLQHGKLEILDRVHFDTNKATIQKRSHELLRNVAAVLGAHPEFRRVQVEGHTDDRGKDAANLDLSQRRAQAVVDFLVAEGVAAERLTPMGFGETRPIEDNRTAKGRLANRRVEFNILDQAANQ